MEVIVKDTYEEVSKLTAQMIADVIIRKPRAVIGLPTGSTPVGTYQELARMHKEEGLDFSKVVTFNMDEYIGLTPDHPQSYRYFMDTNLFNHININPMNIHVPTGNPQNVEAFCEWYEDEIVASGGLDVQLGGIGGNGHIAFNEPGSSLGSLTRVKTLDKETIEANSRFFDNPADVPRFAVTMGVGTVMSAKHVILLANKANKADAVAAAIEGPITAQCPASAIQMHPKATFIMDKAASANLKGQYGSEPAKLELGRRDSD
jgi:glucosamine-6-phosphate deaminase